MNKVLTQMVDQFQRKHQKLPERIVLTPLALAALAVKHSAAPMWRGIPVQCREIKMEEIDGAGPWLGVDVEGRQIVSFDLKGS